MNLPAYFEMDGKHAAMIGSADGGVTVILERGAPGIADFMHSGSVISLDDLPQSFRDTVIEVSNSRKD